MIEYTCKIFRYAYYLVDVKENGRCEYKVFRSLKPVALPRQNRPIWLTIREKQKVHAYFKALTRCKKQETRSRIRTRFVGFIRIFSIKQSLHQVLSLLLTSLSLSLSHTHTHTYSLFILISISPSLSLSFSLCPSIYRFFLSFSLSLYIYICVCVCVCVCGGAWSVMVTVLWLRNGHAYPSSNPSQSCLHFT